MTFEVSDFIYKVAVRLLFGIPLLDKRALPVRAGNQAGLKGHISRAALGTKLELS